VLQNEKLLGRSGERTIFSVKCSSVDVRKYSVFEAENERLLMPGIRFVCAGTLDLGDGVKMVQLQENDVLLPGFSFFTSSCSSHFILFFSLHLVLYLL